MDKAQMNWSKIEALPTVNDMLDDLYGEEGTVGRSVFKKDAYAYYTGKLIEQARKASGLTQSQLAEKVHTNKSYISRIEHGKTEPKVSTFYRIAAALGCSVELSPRT